jgi:hypothetical protein
MVTTTGARAASGAEYLMLHLAVDADPPGGAGHPFVQALLTEELVLGDGDPMISALALDPPPTRTGSPTWTGWAWTPSGWTTPPAGSR